MNRVSGLLRSGLALVGACFPERTKRLIFLASFSARLQNQDNFDRETIRKLNEVMALASNEASINLPVHLSKVIWHGRTLHEFDAPDVLFACYATKECLQQVADHVLQAMPAWLRYGSDSIMREDVARLLDNRSVLIGT